MLHLRSVRDLRISPDSHPRGTAWVSAASGLLRSEGHWVVIADDEHHVAVFPHDPAMPGRLIRLFEGDLPAEPRSRKAHKPDLEALVALPALPGCPAGALWALGSGSAPLRRRSVLFEAMGRWAVRQVDLSEWYAAFEGHFAHLNIEGAFIDGESLCLLHRGNTDDADSACVRFTLSDVLAWLSSAGPVPRLRSVRPIDAGQAHGVALTPTDGCALPDGGWVFSAVAEDTNDPYADGACLGAAIGWVDASGDTRAVVPLTHPWKIEGVWARREGDELHITAVTDADDPDVPAQMLEGIWTLG